MAKTKIVSKHTLIMCVVARGVLFTHKFISLVRNNKCNVSARHRRLARCSRPSVSAISDQNKCISTCTRGDTSVPRFARRRQLLGSMVVDQAQSLARNGSAKWKRVLTALRVAGHRINMSARKDTEGNTQLAFSAISLQIMEPFRKR
jgi:hypothetical protein